jgi:general secretion pathway protein A
MYRRHFGFKERPFRLVPDPAYLFMGRSHREAMAYLSYAVQSGDGFTAVVGEVGTGKTTLCRSFLEQLDPGVTSAYLFNPPADPVDLMRAVNRDFGLPVSEGCLQDLVEDLNRFLIREKAEGRTALLVVDEAQRLSREVLEQIRLLSNLETTRSKLLLIVLVGQPELEQTLNDHGLRQLRQRITARCRLSPLTLAETGAYLRHRLAVAAEGEPVVFTPAAVRVIFGFSAGLPRLINMAADRALLVAYASSKDRIDGRSARGAVRELESDASVRRSPAPGLVAAFVVAILALALHLGAGLRTGLDASSGAIAKGSVTVAAPERAARPPTDALQGAGWRMDRDTALETIAGLWGLAASPPVREAAGDDLAFFQTRCAPLGLSVYPVQAGLDLVGRLDLPALLALAEESGEPGGFAVLAAIDGDRYLLKGRATGVLHPVSAPDLHARWTGSAYVLWRDFYAMAGRIPGGASEEAILHLKEMLRVLGYDRLDPGPVFDPATLQAVIDFQARQGLPADGVVGPQTKIALYNTRPELDIPRLRPAASLHPIAEARQPP